MTRGDTRRKAKQAGQDPSAEYVTQSMDCGPANRCLSVLQEKVLPRIELQKVYTCRVSNANIL